MLANLKINTALFICSAFFFRLLFVNIGMLSSFNHHHTSQTKSRFSVVSKRRKQVEVVPAATKVAEFSAVEICEEESDDNKQIKLSPLLFTLALYSFVAEYLKKAVKTIAASHSPFSHSSIQRYVAFQVFRI